CIGERSDAVLRTAMRERDQFQELGVIVEHLLEMRREPALVDRIAREAAAEMIVDAALADALEREVDGREVARLAGALAGPPQKFEQHRLREFGRAAHAAVDRIDQAADLRRRAI